MKKNNSRLLHVIVLPYLMLISLQAVCQQNLQPGDSIPPIVMASFLNTRQSSINLQTTQKKLVVLDFWATWCSSCIKALPKLDALQASLKEVQIIAVTEQNTKTVQQFFDKKGIALKHLTVKTEDSILKQYFPYQSLPHSVWISEGKVQYVTYGYNINATIISKFLSGIKPNLALKDGTKAYDKTLAVWAGTNTHFGVQPQRYSYLTGWLHEYGSALEMRFTDSNTNAAGIRMINLPLKTLILTAYGRSYNHANRVSLEGSAKQLIVWDNQFGDEDERRSSNLICYELKVPLAEQKNIPKYIQADLERYMDFDIKVQQRKMLCYVIDPPTQPVSACIREGRVEPGNGDRFSFCGGFTSLVAMLQQRFAHDPKPIVDRSGYLGNIHVEAKGQLHDIDDVKQMLAQYGFKMTEQETELPVLVIKDRLSTK